MYSYAGQSATVTKMASFKQAPQVSNASAQTTQGTAVAKATTNATAGNTSNAVSKALTNLAQPATTTTTNTASGPPTSSYSAFGTC